jgi:hypothetical protein
MNSEKKDATMEEFDQFVIYHEMKKVNYVFYFIVLIFLKTAPCISFFI